MSKKVEMVDGKPRRKGFLERAIPPKVMGDLMGAKERLIRIEAKLDYLIEKEGYPVPRVEVPKDPDAEDTAETMEDLLEMAQDMIPPGAGPQ